MSWTKMLYDIEAMQHALLALITIRSTRFYYIKYVLPWIALTLLLRLTIPAITNDLLARHYHESTTVMAFHWLNAAGFATLVVGLLFVRRLAQEVRALSEACIAFANKGDLQVDVEQMKAEWKSLYKVLEAGTVSVLGCGIMVCIGWWFLSAGSMLPEKCPCHAIVFTLVLLFWIAAWIYEFVSLPSRCGVEEMGKAVWNQKEWTEEDVRAFRMAQIRLRGRVVEAVNAARLRHRLVSDEIIHCTLACYRYIPSWQSVYDALAFMQAKGVHLDRAEGEHEETIRIIQDFQYARICSLLQQVRFVLDAGEKDTDSAIQRILLPYYTVPMD